MSKQSFDQKDLEEICSRKPVKVKMKRADFKELGVNALKGSFDVAVGSVLAAGLLGSLGASNKKRSKSEDSGYGYKDGNQGYGFYFGDIKDDD